MNKFTAKEMRRATKWRKGSPEICVTCPASRHAFMIGEALAKGKPYPMLQEEPEHVAETLLSVVGSLWEARLKLAKLQAKRC